MSKSEKYTRTIDYNEQQTNEGQVQGASLNIDYDDLANAYNANASRLDELRRSDSTLGAPRLNNTIVALESLGDDVLSTITLFSNADDPLALIRGEWATATDYANGEIISIAVAINTRKDIMTTVASDGIVTTTFEAEGVLTDTEEDVTVTGIGGNTIQTTTEFGIAQAIAETGSYICLSDHTSDDFLTDLENNLWFQLAGNAFPGAAQELLDQFPSPADGNPLDVIQIQASGAIYENAKTTVVSAGPTDGATVPRLDATGKLDQSVIPGSTAGTTIIPAPMDLEFSFPVNTETTLDSIFGGFDPLSSADVLNSGAPYPVTLGVSRLFFAVLAGADIDGTLTITGDTIDRNTGVLTVADTEDITIDGLTTDSTTVDGLGHNNYDFDDAYQSLKWFTGTVVISTTDLDVSDIDTYSILFNQFNESPNIIVTTLDLTFTTTSTTAELDAHLYTVVTAAGKTSLKIIAELEHAAGQAVAGYRSRLGQLGASIDGATDGVFCELFLAPVNEQRFKDFHLIVQATDQIDAFGIIVPTSELFVDGADYVSGTTTELTLTSTLSDKDDLTVTFAGVSQHHDTFSIAGSPTVVTFTDPIPLGVPSVEISYGIRSGTVLWTSISGTPTTVGGYGITDALSFNTILPADDNITIDGRTFPREITLGALRSNHTAGIDGTRAYHIDIESAGFNDTSGIVIRHDLAGSSANIRPRGMDLQADIAGMTNAHLNFLEFQLTGTLDSSARADAIDVRPGISVIHHHSGTIAAVGKAFTFDDSGASFADVTTAFGSAGTDVQIFVEDDDLIYLGDVAQFSDIEVVLAIVAANPGVKPTFEYSQGASAWAALPVSDGSNGFRENGSIAFAPPGDWATETVNGDAGKFWVRIKRTTNSLGTVPTEDTIKIIAAVEFEWDENGDVNLNDLTARKVIYAPDVDQAITAASDTISSTSSHVEVTPDADYVMTATPSIAPGSDGQNLLLHNLHATNTVTLQDDGVLAGSDVFLGGAEGTVKPGSTMTLHYSADMSGWAVTSNPNTASVGAAANIVPIRNVSGGALGAGVAVYVTGNVGLRPTVDVADANVAAQMPAVGIIASAIGDNANGDMITAGLAIGVIDTSTASINDGVWIDEATPGGVVFTRPTVDEVQRIGTVVRVHASQGSILVAGAGRANDTPIDLPDQTTAITQSSNDNSTKVATTAYADTAAAGGGATLALNNLVSVALNIALLPDAAAADDFGSATLPFKDLWFAGSSGTPETNNFQITGASTSGTRVATFPDASGTVILGGQDNTAQKINLLDYGEITNAIGGTGGGTQDIDLELGNSVTATVDTSTNTFTFSNPTASDELCGFSLGLTNGGSQTVNWPASVDWAGGTAPTLTAAGYDELVFWTRDGGTIWHGASVSLDSS